MKDPVQTATQDAVETALCLINRATHAALAVLQPGTVAPSVSRIALATDPEGAPISLISELSSHTRALEENPNCALLIGEPGPKGDPLTHPRLTLHANAQIVPRESDVHARLRVTYITQRPKAALYADFADFRFVTFKISDGLLNGGFGKAFRLTKADLSKT